MSRLVMAADVHVLVHVFGHAYIVGKTLEELFRGQNPLEVLVDSRMIFSAIAKDSGTAERKLPIDICPLRERPRSVEL